MEGRLGVRVRTGAGATRICETHREPPGPNLQVWVRVRQAEKSRKPVKERTRWENKVWNCGAERLESWFYYGSFIKHWFCFFFKAKCLISLTHFFFPPKEDLELLLDRVNDWIEFRIDAILEEMSHMPLCRLPQEEPLTCEEFLQMTKVSRIFMFLLNFF